MSKKEPNRTRNKRVTLRFTEEEYERFKLKKEKSQYNNYTDFVIRATYDVPIYVIDIKPVLSLLTELSRIGNNINQIAKVTNETHNIYENDVRDLIDKVDKVGNLVSNTLRLVVKHRQNDLLKFLWLNV